MGDLGGKRLLILGCGYLGARLVESARSKGLSVSAVSRNPDTLERLEDDGVSCCQALVESDVWHGFAGCDIDFVVNCVSSAGGGLAGYEQSYIEGNRSLVRWSSEAGFKGKAIYTSSVSVYGDAGGSLVSEAEAAEPSSRRGKLMRNSEKIFLEGLREVERYVLRLAGLYGPSRHLLLDRIRQAKGGKLPGEGGYYLNLARIEDVVTAIWACIQAKPGKEGVYNVVDDEPVLKEVFVNWIADQLDVARPSYSGKKHVDTVSSRRFSESGPPANRRISNTAIKSALGWEPAYPSYREGFASLIGKGDSV